ncbi:MAG: pitrilysin family protein [bacterium]
MPARAPVARPLTRPATRRLPITGGGTIIRTALPGGLRVVTEAMPGARSASVGVWVGVGSADEGPTVAGASHYLEHLLFKGTRRRSALDIAAAMDAVGGEFNAFTEKEHTCFYATVLDRDLPLAIDIVSDVVLEATVTAADVEVERSVVLEEIAMRDDDPSDLVHDDFSTAMFGDTPIGRPILGTIESINALTRAQVAGYYRRRYRPQTMVVAAAGAVDHTGVVRLVRAAFDGHLHDGAVPAPVRRGPATEGREGSVSVRGDDTEQANIVVGMRGLHRHDPRRFALSVLSTAVGGGMSSRLFQQIRERRGLAYSVYSFTSQYAATGQFGVYAGCQPGKADEVLDIILREMEDVAANGLRPEEIERGKGQVRGGMVLGLEDPGARMTRIGKSELAYGDILGVDDLLARVDEVDRATVAVLAEEILSRPRCLSVVGPFGDHDFDGALGSLP